MGMRSWARDHVRQRCGTQVEGRAGYNSEEMLQEAHVRAGDSLPILSYFSARGACACWRFLVFPLLFLCKRRICVPGIPFLSSLISLQEAHVRAGDSLSFLSYLSARGTCARQGFLSFALFSSKRGRRAC
eukprot:1158651-Pelagomonas_calceolata.AAC.8